MSISLESGPFASRRGREKDQSSVQLDDFDSEMMLIGESLQITPSTLEVDFDKNLTELYQAITDQDWKRVAIVCRTDPIQAATWVVRHYNDDNDETFSASIKSPEQDPEIMWRFLPLHSACARQPPRETVALLLNAYPDAAKCIDDQGMYALHYACGNQADESVIKLLLVAFSKAAAIPDPRGMLPLHYMACWGPSSSSYSQGVLNELIQAHPPALTMRDFDGNTPLNLAMDGDYPEKDTVVDVFRQLTSRMSSEKNRLSQGRSNVLDHSQTEPIKLKLLSIRQTNSHGSGYNDAIFVDQSIKVPLEPPASHSEDSASTENNAVVNLATATTANSSVTPTPHLSNGLSLQSESRESPGPVLVRNLTKTPPNVGVPPFANRNAGIVYAVETVRSSSSVEMSRQNERSTVEQIDGVSKSGHAVIESEVKQPSFHDTTSELKEKINCIAALEEELKSVSILLEESKLECSGLRQSLGDLMDEHEKIKQKSANTYDRLSSLSVSLNSMREQQSILSTIVAERNEICKSTAEKRQRLFDELLKMDVDVAEAEGLVNSSLRKQTREMDAISAVINAALD
jgi:Ankyrin repeats (many copies)